MQLSDPVRPAVEFADLGHENPHEAVALGGRKFLPGHGLSEHCIGVGEIIVRPQRQFDAVVAGPAAAFGKVIVTAFNRAEEVLERDQFHAETLLDLIHVGAPAGGENLLPKAALARSWSSSLSMRSSVEHMTSTLSGPVRRA